MSKSIEDEAREVGLEITPEAMNKAMQHAQEKIFAFYKACEEELDRDSVIKAADDAINALIATSNMQSTYSNQLALLLGKLSDEISGKGNKS